MSGTTGSVEVMSGANQATTQFYKYEGLGNDFVIIEADSAAVERLAPLTQALCDRHFGIGGDGVLLVVPPALSSARARMIVMNRDGSRPEMCGNGLRCVALHLARVDACASATYDVETDAGVLRCRVERDGNAGQVEITLGRAQPSGEREFAFEGKVYHFDLVSMGNPHAITFDAELTLEQIDRLGPQVSASLPGGSNVEFVRAGQRGFDLIVWERGVGRTLACGTGAGATAVGLANARRAPFGEAVRLLLPGGGLDVTVSPALDVTLRGPARFVFSGARP